MELFSSNGIADKTLFSEVMCETLAASPPVRLLDIGCGSGIIGLFALLNGSEYVYFNDIQPDAITLTKRNLKHHQIPSSAYQFINLPFQKIDLASCQFDAIAFNPPQLPTQMVSIEKFGAQQEKIFRDGGPNGLHLIEQFIDWLAKSLPNNTRAYLGISSMLLVDDLLDKVQQKGLLAEKKHQRTVPLRDIFHPLIEQMPESLRQRRKLSKRDDQWYKKIYALEFRRNV